MLTAQTVQTKWKRLQKHSRCKGCYRKLYDAQMIVEFEDGQDPKSVMQDVLKNCKKVEDDCEIFL